MYKHNSRFQKRNRNFGSTSTNGNVRRGFRAKTFDPSHIIRNQPESKQEEEYIVKNNFTDLKISERLKQNIASHGYKIPTPIQDQTIPKILDGTDVVGIANTGTGKTAAFLIPLINKIIKSPTQKVLIIAPTRELSIQIEDELNQFTSKLGINSIVCIGGVSINNQVQKLINNPQFVIGTPGRLLDLSRQRRLDFRRFESVVLDEVDRMLDMGFIKDVQQIIDQLPSYRQSLFFSATVGRNVLKIMQQFTTDPLIISVKSQDAAINVHQEVIKVKGNKKVQVLENLLDQKDFEKVLVFGRTKRGAENLARHLNRVGFFVSAIHGNKTQNQRQRSLDMFKSGKVKILVATDVVARGIDVDDITHVINYELPESYDHYLHRIGRTGRADKKGVALTFVS